jgi:hypothetical protein
MDIESLKSLEAQFIRTAQAIREHIASFDTISSFSFELSANGRTQSGDLKVEFTVAPNDWSGSKVVSNSIESAVNEMLRREGFDLTHKPLCLPKYEAPKPAFDRPDSLLHVVSSNES